MKKEKKPKLTEMEILAVINQSVSDSDDWNNSNLELLWVPLIDKEENRVTTPLTFVGAWGVPVAPKPEFLSSLTIETKEMLYDQHVEAAHP